MSDRTACANTLCPQRMECLRYRLVWDNLWQSFATYTPDPVSGKCDSHLSLLKSDRTVTPDVADSRVRVRGHEV